MPGVKGVQQLQVLLDVSSNLKLHVVHDLNNVQS